MKNSDFKRKNCIIIKKIKILIFLSMYEDE